MRHIGMALIAVTVAALTACSAGVDGDATADDSATMLADSSVFLEHVKTKWDGLRPDDDVLLSHGSIACTQLQAGVPHATVTIFAGAETSPEAVANTRSVVDAAALALCPAATQ